MNFNISKNNCQVLLQWKTISSSNTAKFIIGKSTDGIKWLNAGTIPISTPNMLNYTFSDANLTTGNILYRINVIDKYGISELSNIKSIHNECFQRNNIIAMPNPITSELKIRIQNSEMYKGEIYNANMQRLQSFIDIKNGSVINISKLEKGIYFLQLQNTQDKITQYIKLIKE